MSDASKNWTDQVNLSSHCDIGNFRQSNEDTYIVSELIVNKSNDSILFLGIFDGHGGKECSKYLEHHLPQYLDERIDVLDIDSIEANITDACKTLNADFLKEFTDFHGGSCAILGFIIPTDNSYVLLTANIGDSYGIIVDKEQESISLNKLHKPIDPVEKAYIESQGGEVFGGRVMGLAVSRAFGDADITKFIRVDPEFTLIELTNNHKYIVYGSDGLWDVTDEDQITILLENSNNEENLAKLLSDYALENGSMDNVTTIVADITNLPR